MLPPLPSLTTGNTGHQWTQADQDLALTLRRVFANVTALIAFMEALHSEIAEQKLDAKVKVSVLGPGASQAARRCGSTRHCDEC